MSEEDGNGEKKRHRHHGKSSRSFLDAGAILDGFGLGPDETVLDLGCGDGHFAIEAAERVDFDTAVYALDLWPDSIEGLREELEDLGLRKVKPILADATEEIPLPADTVRVCIMVNVLHGFVHNGEFDDLMEQLVPVLHTRCRILIVDYRRVEDEHGPPLEVRVDPEEALSLFEPYGFSMGKEVEVEKNRYAVELVR
ncbi:MAG: class I SAM-dependent methyltransferase [bacterium]